MELIEVVDEVAHCHVKVIVNELLLASVKDAKIDESNSFEG